MSESSARIINGIHGKIEGAQGRSSGDVELRYRPMMTVQTKVVSTFHILPIRRINDTEFQSGDDVLRTDARPRTTEELDRLIIDEVADELAQLVEHGGKSLFVVPVHFSTLDDVESAREYCTLSSERLKGYESRLILEIIDIPTMTDARRLAQVMKPTQPLTRAILARLPHDVPTNTDYRHAGLHAIGMDIYDQSRGEKAVMEDMDAFVEVARHNRIKCYVVGVRTTSLLTAAISSGFNYISGHVIGAPCIHVDDIRTFRPETLYRMSGDDNAERIHR